MAKSIDKSANEEELQELEEFLKNIPRYRKLMQVTNALKTKPQTTGSELAEKDVDQGLSELWLKIKGPGNLPDLNVTSGNHFFSLRNWRWAGSAAAVLIFTSLGALVYRYHNRAMPAKNVTIVRISVPFGKSLQLTLPDSSKVKLNAGSHFSYPSEFSARVREVSLDGEGFFVVTKNPAKPFLVHTKDLTVRVLGTTFNIKAYKEEKKVETTLLKGKVLIELDNDPAQKIILLPNEKFTVNDIRPAMNTGGPGGKPENKVKYQLTTLQGADNGEYQENAWINDKIVFTNDGFEDVAKQMERKYDVHIIFEDQALKQEQISGVLKNESLEDALKLLKQITAFNYRVDKQNIYLSVPEKR